VTYYLGASGDPEEDESRSYDLPPTTRTKPDEKILRELAKAGLSKRGADCRIQPQDREKDPGRAGEGGAAPPTHLSTLLAGRSQPPLRWRLAET
jgi:hypothetical protein